MIRRSADSREIVEFTGQFMPVGQKFYLSGYRGDVYRVVENHDCAGCGLVSDCFVWSSIPNCDKKFRIDGKDVIFQLL